MFTKEVNIEIITALCSFGPIKKHDNENWKKLHARLAKDIRDIKRVNVQEFKRNVIKLMFDIKQNKFNIPQRDVKILCYPYLDLLLKLKLVINKSLNYKITPCEKLYRQKVILKYLLSDSFQQELWDQLHTFSLQYPEEYHIINLRNPQYGLTKKQIMTLNKFVYVSTSNKGSRTTLISDQQKWLSKKTSSYKLVDPPEEQRQVYAKNGCKSSDSPVQKAILGNNSGKITEVELAERSQLFVSVNLPDIDTNTSREPLRESNELSRQFCHNNPHVLNGLENIALNHPSDNTTCANNEFASIVTNNPILHDVNHSKAKSISPEEIDIVEISSDSEDTFFIPYSFYDDINSDSEIDTA